MPGATSSEGLSKAESLGIWHAVILGILEGLTEFLPVSSTGHLNIAEDFLGVNDGRGKAFAIIIQLCAILAVCVAYRAKLFEVLLGLPREPAARRFVMNVLIIHSCDGARRSTARTDQKLPVLAGHGGGSADHRWRDHPVGRVAAAPAARARHR